MANAKVTQSKHIFQGLIKKLAQNLGRRSMCVVDYDNRKLEGVTSFALWLLFLVTPHVYYYPLLRAERSNNG